MKFDIVVAHYRENVDWALRINHPLLRKVFIYTKGPVVADMNSDIVFHSYLPNVGRESHTYLWHCVHNFEEMKNGSMADFTFFVQGSPHSLNATQILQWAEEIDRHSLEFTLNYKIASPYDFLPGGRIGFYAGPTQPAKFDVGGWCKEYVKESFDSKSMPIFWNGCLGVSTRRILASDRRRLAVMQQNELSTINPECGHYCERLWYHIFRMEDANQSLLPEGFWHFFGGPDGRRHYGIMKLREDGRIIFYDNPNEATWSIEEGAMVFRGRSGKVTSIMPRVSDDEFSGHFVGPEKSLHKITRRNPIEK